MQHLRKILEKNNLIGGYRCFVSKSKIVYLYTVFLGNYAPKYKLLAESLPEKVSIFPVGLRPIRMRILNGKIIRFEENTPQPYIEFVDFYDGLKILILTRNNRKILELYRVQPFTLEGGILNLCIKYNISLLKYIPHNLNTVNANYITAELVDTNQKTLRNSKYNVQILNEMIAKISPSYSGAFYRRGKENIIIFNNQVEFQLKTDEVPQWTPDRQFMESFSSSKQFYRKYSMTELEPYCYNPPSFYNSDSILNLLRLRAKKGLISVNFELWKMFEN